jgi:hypothetical protein
VEGETFFALPRPSAPGRLRSCRCSRIRKNPPLVRRSGDAGEGAKNELSEAFSIQPEMFLHRMTMGRGFPAL